MHCLFKKSITFVPFFYEKTELMSRFYFTYSFFYFYFNSE
jgi:hypothetical protein